MHSDFSLNIIIVHRWVQMRGNCDPGGIEWLAADDMPNLLYLAECSSSGCAHAIQYSRPTHKKHLCKKLSLRFSKK